VREVYPPEVRSAVIRTVESWTKFCGLPEEVKTNINYENGFGYELKKVPGKRLDLKENFHVALAGHNRLTKIAKTLGVLEIEQFIEDGERLIKLVIPLIKDFSEKTESGFGLKGLTEEVMANQDSWTIRFLHYFGVGEKGSEMAAPHSDKGGFTLHLYEGDSGLQCLNFENEWVGMPVSEKETVIIAGMQLQYRSQNKLKALCHRVVSTPKTAKSGRYSAVCFISLKKTPAYNKDGFGRLQEFPPGFNYTMPFSEFSKMFV